MEKNFLNENSPEFKCKSKNKRHRPRCGPYNITNRKTDTLCLICGRDFGRFDYLLRHQKRMHIPNIDFNAKCDICGKVFKTSKLPPRHKQLCVKLRHPPPVCEFCGVQLSTKAVYVRHMLGHTGETPFPCNVCEKKFKSKDKLKIHLRVHTGEKPYMCSFCGRKFGTNNTLKDHIRTHTKEKPFKCDVCDRGFTQRSALKTHRIQHISNKPYDCKTCNLVFGSRTLLKGHQCINL